MPSLVLSCVAVIRAAVLTDLRARRVGHAEMLHSRGVSKPSLGNLRVKHTERHAVCLDMRTATENCPSTTQVDSTFNGHNS